MAVTKHDTPNGPLEVIGLAVVAVPFILAMYLGSLMWFAWWLYPAWQWFVVPLGLPTISFWHFVALVLCVRTITQRVDAKKDTRETEWPTVVIAFFLPALAWVLLRWMAP